MTLVQTHHPIAAGVALLLCLAPAARADRYEATLAVRPTGGYARIAETGADAAALVRSAGIAGGLSWGVRNWLDVGGELAASRARRGHLRPGDGPRR